MRRLNLIGNLCTKGKIDYDTWKYLTYQVYKKRIIREQRKDKNSDNRTLKKYKELSINQKINSKVDWCNTKDRPVRTIYHFLFAVVFRFKNYSQLNTDEQK